MLASRSLRRLEVAPWIPAALLLCPGCEFTYPEAGPPAEVAPVEEPVSAGDAGEAELPDTGQAPSPASGAPRSCLDVLRTVGSGHDGYYAIDADGEGAAPALEVYCDLTIDGGGWLLIGRSVTAAVEDDEDEAGGAVSFGWRGRTGDVRVETAPFALDASAIGGFTEILIGTYTAGKTLSGRAYAIAVDASFMSVCVGRACEGTPRTVLGDCSPPGGPANLRRAGFTESAQYYDFRDPMRGGKNSGLFASGFDLGGRDCNGSGQLTGEQGLIFVR